MRQCKIVVRDREEHLVPSPRESEGVTHRFPQPFGAILRGLRRPEAARYIGISPSKFDELVRDGRMPHPFRVDTCTLWDIHDLDAAIDDLKHADTRNPWDNGGAT